MIKKLLLYCTKSKPYLLKLKDKDVDFFSNYKQWLVDDDKKYTSFSFNGEVVAECDFEVEEITPSNLVDFEKESCVDRVSMLKYFKPNLIWDNKFETLLNTFGNSTLGYAIHIKNLHIFDEPKELNKFKQKGEYQCSKRKCPYFDTEKCHYSSVCLYEKIITKAPQNMMYCYDCNGEKKIIISIHSEWLCKIFNGEKTVEMRKKVLREMLYEK